MYLHRLQIYVIEENERKLLEFEFPSLAGSEGPSQIFFIHASFTQIFSRTLKNFFDFSKPFLECEEANLFLSNDKGELVQLSRRRGGQDLVAFVGEKTTSLSTEEAWSKFFRLEFSEETIFQKKDTIQSFIYDELSSKWFNTDEAWFKLFEEQKSAYLGSIDAVLSSIGIEKELGLKEKIQFSQQLLKTQNYLEQFKLLCENAPNQLPSDHNSVEKSFKSEELSLLGQIWAKTREFAKERLNPIEIDAELSHIKTDISQITLDIKEILGSSFCEKAFFQKSDAETIRSLEQALLVFHDLIKVKTKIDYLEDLKAKALSYTKALTQHLDQNFSIDRLSQVTKETTKAVEFYNSFLEGLDSLKQYFNKFLAEQSNKKQLSVIQQFFAASFKNDKLPKSEAIEVKLSEQVEKFIKQVRETRPVLEVLGLKLNETTWDLKRKSEQISASPLIIDEELLKLEKLSTRFEEILRLLEHTKTEYIVEALPLLSIWREKLERKLFLENLRARWLTIKPGLIQKICAYWDLSQKNLNFENSRESKDLSLLEDDGYLLCEIKSLAAFFESRSKSLEQFWSNPEKNAAILSSYIEASWFERLSIIYQEKCLKELEPLGIDAKAWRKNLQSYANLQDFISSLNSLKENSFGLQVLEEKLQNSLLNLEGGGVFLLDSTLLSGSEEESKAGSENNFFNGMKVALSSICSEFEVGEGESYTEEKELFSLEKFVIVFATYNTSDILRVRDNFNKTPWHFVLTRVRSEQQTSLREEVNFKDEPTSIPGESEKASSEIVDVKSERRRERINQAIKVFRADIIRK